MLSMGQNKPILSESKGFCLGLIDSVLHSQTNHAEHKARQTNLIRVQRFCMVEFDGFSTTVPGASYTNLISVQRFCLRLIDS